MTRQCMKLRKFGIRSCSAAFDLTAALRDSFFSIYLGAYVSAYALWLAAFQYLRLVYERQE